jgi:hypothetical protein
MKMRMLMMVVVVGIAGLAMGKPETMSLQTREGDLRATPSYLGAIVGKASYGDRFTVEETRGAWIRVTAESGVPSGWLHSSALTRKTVKLKPGEKDADVAASSGELALAGKGFNSDVEAEFKKQNTTANFKAVDLIEALKVSAREVQAFLKQGAVTPKGGAQ